MDILTVKNLTKRFGKFTAVNNISFSLKEGEILGLLGPNGAGKTTTIQMLLGVLTPTQGEVKYFGKNLIDNKEEILEKVNFSSTYTQLPWLLTVEENLKFVSYLYEIKNRGQRIKKIIEAFRLKGLFKEQMKDLSSGEVTRINLAKAFINYPKILLLDEPTASLDPETADYIRKFLIKERNKFNISIIWTSHNMAEVESLCDRVIILKDGLIVGNDTPSVLAKKIEFSRLRLRVTKNPLELDKLVAHHQLSISVNENISTITIKEQLLPLFLYELTKKNVHYSEISIDKPTLEDYFMKIAKGENT